MNAWLRLWVLRWLGIDADDEPQQPTQGNPAAEAPRPAAPKASGALYAEIRAAKAEIVQARDAIQQSVQEAERRSRMDNYALQRALTDYENTLAEIQMCQQKLDAALEALGFVVVAGDEVVLTRIDSRALRSKRLLEAQVAIRELGLMLTRARHVADGIATVGERVGVQVGRPSVTRRYPEWRPDASRNAT